MRENGVIQGFQKIIKAPLKIFMKQQNEKKCTNY